MNETKTVRVVDISDEPRQVFPALPGLGRAVLIPQSVTIEVDGLGWLQTLTLVRQKDGLVVDEVRIRRPPGGRLPQRAYREPKLGDLVEVLQDVVQIGDITDTDGFSATVNETDGERIPTYVAEYLLRGRTKKRQDVELKRKQAIWEYRKIKRSGERSSDIYAEVGRRINVSRATAARYLKDSGEIDRWKS